MKLLPILIFFFFASCSISDKIEQSHYDLYNQKAFFCIGFDDDRAIFINPQGTKKYICKNKNLSGEWNNGDTLLLNNIPKEEARFTSEYQTFWSLKPYKK
jgi:hypothetical protein